MRFLALLLSTALALECNICGPGNEMTLEKGIVVLEYEGVEYKQNCQKWQDNQMIPEDWCEQNMLQYTYQACGCFDPANQAFLSDVLAPTTSPTTQEEFESSGPRGSVEEVEEQPQGDNDASGSVVLAAGLAMGALLL